MPHENKYRKTREGYLIELEERLNADQLPKEYQRLSIASLHELAEIARIYGIDKFNEYAIYALGLPKVGK